MNNRHLIIASFALALALLAFGYWALAQMPVGARLPVHWNIAGQVDRWEDGRAAIWIMPIAIAVCSALFTALTTMAPTNRGLLQSGAILKVTWVGLLGLLSFCQVMIVAPGLGWTISIMAVPFGLGLLFVALGNVLPKSRPNRFAGIRTPWSMASTDNWIATHRAGGRLFMIGGVALVLAALLPLPPAARLSLVIGAIVTVTVLPVAFSWWYARSHPPRP